MRRPCLTLLLLTAVCARAADEPVRYVPADPPTTWTRTSKLPLNQRVLRYCEKNLGKTVGTGPTRGECAELNGHALLAAGARARFAPRSDTATRHDYVWGKLIATFKTGSVDAGVVQPGDLLQIRGPKDTPSFKGPASNGGTYFSTYTQHSAVVQAVGRSGEAWWLMTYDQNTAGPSGRLERRVKEGARIKLADIQPDVTVWVYRPIAR